MEKNRVRAAFCPPVLSQLQNVSRKLLSLPSSGVMWRIEHGMRGRPPSFAGTWRAPTTIHGTRVRDALACFNFWVSDSGYHNKKVQIGAWASSWNKHCTGDDSLITLNKRGESLQPGGVVQSLVSSLPLCSNVHCTIKVLNSPTKGVGHILSVSYWLVLELFEA
jgi:hypothetical protein